MSRCAKIGTRCDSGAIHVSFPASGGSGGSGGGGGSWAMAGRPGFLASVALQMLQVQLAPGSTAVPRPLGPQAWTRMVRTTWINVVT